MTQQALQQRRQQWHTEWRRVVPELDHVLEQMQQQPIVAVGITPFPRIMPALFLDAYSIFCVRDTTDVDVLREYADIFCLEQKRPAVAAKVQSTTYLLSHHVFQTYLRSLKRPARIMLNLTTAPIVRKMDELGMKWIGNRVETYRDVEVKQTFRALVERLGLPHMPYWQVTREEFLSMTYADLRKHWDKPVVVQRADSNVTGEEARTFFLHTEAEWQRVHDLFANDQRFTMVQMSPFIDGYSVSMLGCITPHGVLTSGLQLELVDIPEVKRGSPASGSWLGHDWGFHPWSERVEHAAQHVVETIGAFMARKGYKGVFGIDMVVEKGTDNLYPVECNPRFTGAQPTMSLMQLHHHHMPPFEFFHLMAHLGVEAEFNFDKVNQAYKQHIALSHLCIETKGIETMRLPLSAGVYAYARDTGELTFRRPQPFLWDIQDPSSEFLLIDSVPREGYKIHQGVQRLMKFIFPRSIADDSSNRITAETAEIVTRLIDALQGVQR